MKNVTSNQITLGLLFMFGILFSSCNREYTCSCALGNNSTSEVWKDLKKSEAVDSCAAANIEIEVYGGACSLQ